MNELGFRPSEDPDLAKRTGYIAEREDLFKTKVFELKIQEADPGTIEQNVLVVSRDPGSASCLVPVMKILEKNPASQIAVVTDGRAEDAIRNHFEVEEKDIEGSIGADRAVGQPDVILVAAAEEKGLETYANATFDEVPMVLIEDYPGATHIFLRACLDRPGLHLPDKTCVMDEAAKQLMVASFSDHPEIESRIEVTGQPAFDRIANENVAEISKNAREKMGLSADDKVVAFMSTDEVTKEQARQICEKLKNPSTDFTLVFRRHPRDNTSYDEYFQMFEEMGIKNIDSRELKTDEVSAAADVVLTSWSTAGLEAIYRGKPTIHIVDRNVLDIPENLKLPLPVVKLGASVGIDDVRELAEKIDGLLDSSSDLSRRIDANMVKYYPNDGKNAERVVAVINEIIGIEREHI